MLLKSFVSRQVLAGALAASAALGVAAPVLAQAWIGQIVGDMMARQAAWQQEHNCMMGAALPPSEIDETRVPANLAMAKYWSVVSPGGEQDIADIFESDKDGRWIDGARELRQGKIVRVTDRFALPGAKAEAEPVWLMRSGDGVHVRAMYRVTGAGGTPNGGYDVTLRRNLGRWHLRRIVLTDAAALPAPLVQFCHKEGDVAPYQVMWAEQERLRAIKQAEKAARKAAKAAAAAAKAK